MNSTEQSEIEEKNKLQALKEELENRINSIREDLKRGLDRDSEEQAVQLQNYEVLLGLLQQAEDELKTINEKLLDLEAG